VWLLDPTWLNAQNRFLKDNGVEGPILPAWREARAYLVDLEIAYEGKNIRRKFPVAIEAPHVDTRLHAQASRFVVFGTARDLAKMFEIRSNQLGLARLPISRRGVKQIEDELAVLGVHAASVFPDVSGLGQYVRDQWSLRQ
jgi:hypothetical protein